MHCARCWEGSCEQAKLLPLWSCRSSGGFERKTINKYMYKYQLQMVISSMKKCGADKMLAHSREYKPEGAIWKQEGGWRRRRDKPKNHEMCPPHPHLPGGHSREATCVGETQKPFPDESWVPWKRIGWVIDHLVMCSFLPTRSLPNSSLSPPRLPWHWKQPQMVTSGWGQKYRQVDLQPSSPFFPLAGPGHSNHKGCFCKEQCQESVPTSSLMRVGGWWHMGSCQIHTVMPEAIPRPTHIPWAH